MATYGSIRYSGVADAGVAGGTDAYTNTTDLPTSNVDTGTMAYVSSTNKLYMWNGSAWFNIAIVNQAPTAITGNNGTYELAIDGTPTTITLVSTDPEGFPLTWSATTSGDTQVATVTNTDNVFTVTPSTNEADTGTLSVTFSVTDGSNTETSVSSFTLAFLSPLWDETVLSIGTSSTNSLANSTFIDRSTNAHTVTPTGSPVQTAFHPYLDNWSVFLNGGPYLWTEDMGTSVQWGTGDFTIEFWHHTAGVGSNQTIIERNTSNNNVGTNRLIIGMNTSGNVRLWTTGTERTTNTPLPTNQWNHVALVRSSGTCYLYVNGTLGYSFAYTHNFSATSTNFSIGRNADTNEPTFNTFVSNVRITSDAVYTADFTPTTKRLEATANTSLLTCQSNRFIDNSINNFTFTIDGVKISAFNPFGQGSEYTSGQNKGSYLAVNNSWLGIDGSSIDFTQNWTIECWVYYDASAVGSGIVSSINAGSGLDGIYFLNNSDFYLTVTGSNWHIAYAADADLKRYQWHHCAMTWDGNTYTVWVDGISKATYSSTSPVSFSSQAIGVGATSTGSGQFGGYISDFNITTGTAKYTTTFTPPTSPVGNTNASLYLPMDNAGIYDKTGNNTLTLNGNAVTSTTQTKFADTAIYFDGSGDYVNIENIGIISNDFTMEGWFYISGTTGQGTLGQQGIIGRGPIPGDMVVRVEGTTTKVMSWWLDHSDSNVVGTTTLSLNSWYHFALVRSGTGTNNVKLYLNGTLESQGTTSYVSPNENFIIGRVYTNLDSEYFNGYIENLQILKGVAKYTTNFTPPNRTQGITYQAES